jgi:hypothetical protein
MSIRAGHKPPRQIPFSRTLAVVDEQLTKCVDEDLDRINVLKLSGGEAL